MCPNFKVKIWLSNGSNELKNTYPSFVIKGQINDILANVFVLIGLNELRLMIN